jgi:hypothetical protein
MRRTLSLILTAAFALSMAASADAAGSCRDAKGKYVKCPAAASATTAGKSASATTAATSGAGPNCKKGKRCGNSCISMKDTCHK